MGAAKVRKVTNAKQAVIKGAMKTKRVVMKAKRIAREPAGRGKVTAEKKYVYTTRKNGKKAIIRPFTDLKSWEARRVVEKPPPGGWPTPPAHWPPGVRVHIGRPAYWLPKGWGQGVKTTCVAHLTAFVSPEGKMYYHRHMIEKVLGRKLAPEDTLQGATSWACQQIPKGKDWRGKPVKFAAESRLFGCLGKRERDQLVGPEAFHFAVVSARRAEDVRGIRSIVAVQAQLAACGVSARWYVDAPSLKAYKNLGLDAVVGGKLVPARNKALADAGRAGKVCVQLSDDISRWEYYKAKEDGDIGIYAGNEAAKNADKLRISPLAAARFLLARMRGVPAGQPQPKLGGVFPLANTGMAFSKESISTEHFILGDFFVHDGSPCRFEPRMTLKEDYDFTCAHLARHGAVLRCNRMMLAVTHETNAGGACSERDSSGERERENIRILKEKWPGVFHVNGNRGDDGTQVVMSWKRRRH